jgi:carbamate kinase
VHELPGEPAAGVLIVTGLGGNALQRGAVTAVGVDPPVLEAAADALAALAREHQLLVTHGNGPQVGMLALQAAAAGGGAPLDVLDAESEGLVGYRLEQALGNRLPGTEVATLLTQVVVDPDDPAFGRPTKPIGPRYTEADARRIAAEHGWAVAADGDAWRRVVPSPAPEAVVELGTVEILLDGGVLVVCAGGGGIPVVMDDTGALHGVEAVVDKDATTALLAAELGADHLLLLTDVEGVAVGFGTADERWVRRADPEALSVLDLPPGSMGAKVAAACRFVAETGRRASIGSLAAARDVLAGTAGTTVTLATDGLELAPTGHPVRTSPPPTPRSPPEDPVPDHPTTSDTIVVPLDGSALADRAVPVATRLARAVGGSVLLVAVAADDRARALASHLDELASEITDVPVDTRVTTGDDAADTIVELAATRDATVCMTSHGRTGLRWAVLGSVAEQVVARADRPVLLVGPHTHADASAGSGPIVVGHDGAPLDDAFVDAACAWAARLGTTLLLTTVIHPLDVDDAERPEQLFADAEARIRARGGTVDHLVVQRHFPAGVLADIAIDRAAPLVMMGSHGRRGLERLVLGSTTMCVLDLVPCPVLAAPPATRG